MKKTLLILIAFISFLGLAEGAWASITINSVSLNPTSVVVGDNVALTVQVTRVGSSCDNNWYSTKVKINGETVLDSEVNSPHYIGATTDTDNYNFTAPVLTGAYEVTVEAWKGPEPDIPTCTVELGSSATTSLTIGWKAQTASTSPKSLENSTATGTVAWVNPTYATSSDNSRATFTSTASAVSNYLLAQNFGFNIPPTASIDGIIVEVEKSHASSNFRKGDSEVKLIKSDGTTFSENRAYVGTNWTTTDTYKVYGSSTDKWGETWTPSEINNSLFKVAFSASITNDASPQEFRVDHIRVTVFYTDNSILLDSYPTNYFVGSLSVGGDGGEIFPIFYQTFKPNTTANLNSAYLFLKKTLSPTGNATVYVYNTSGTCGSTGVPRSTPIAMSNTFDVSTLTTTNQLIDFTFIQKPVLTKDSCYALLIEYTGGDSDNFLGLGVDNNTLGHSGNFGWKETIGSGYTAYAYYDQIFYVYGYGYAPPVSAQFLSSVQLKGNVQIK